MCICYLFILTRTFSVHRCLGERRFVLFYCPSADGFFIKYASRCDFGVRFAAPTEYVFRVRRRCCTPLRGPARACVSLRPLIVDSVCDAERLLCRGTAGLLAAAIN